MLITAISSILLASNALAPLGPAQEARLSALLAWSEAYRDCYAPAPFSFEIDPGFTATCIEATLGKGGDGGSPEQRAVLAALIAQTPRLISLLNTPARGHAAATARSDPAAGAPSAALAPAAHR